MHTTLILSVSLLLNATPPLEQENLVRNPSFEEVAAGNPVHWDFRVQQNAAPILVDEAAHDGEHCVRMVDMASEAWPADSPSGSHLVARRRPVLLPIC